jgi:outer membrane protein assembly factor BamB
MIAFGGIHKGSFEGIITRVLCPILMVCVLGAAASEEIPQEESPKTPQYLWTIGERGIGKEGILLSLGYRFRDINEDGFVDFVIKGYGYNRRADNFPSLAAWDGKTGERMWVKDARSDNYFIKRATDEHLVVSETVLSRSAMIWGGAKSKTRSTQQFSALDWSTGKVLWHVPTTGYLIGEWILSLSKTGTSVYDAATGELSWENDLVINIPVRSMKRTGRSFSSGMMRYTPIAFTSLHLRGNKLIARTPRSIVAVSMKDGSLLWEFQTEKKISVPTSTEEHVLFIDRNKTLYAVEIESGELAWKTEIPQSAKMWEELHLLSDLVFCLTTSQRKIHAFSLEDGAHRWSFKAPASGGAEESTGGYAWVSEVEGLKRVAMYSQDSLSILDIPMSIRVPSGVQEPDEVTTTQWGYYIQADDRHVEMLDYKSGDTTWKLSASSSFEDFSFDVVNEKLFYIAGDKLAAHSLTTGEEHWSRELEQPKSVAFSPGFAILLVRLKDLTLLCLDAEGGETLWQMELPKYGWAWKVDKNRLFVYRYGQISAYDMDFELMRSRYVEKEQQTEEAEEEPLPEEPVPAPAEAQETAE